MAIARTTVGAFVSAADFGTGAFTTSSFTPPDNSLLVVAVAAMENAGTTDPTADMTLSGGGLTWTAREDGFDIATWSQGIKIWTAPVTTGASMTLTADCAARNIYKYRISAVAYTGYDTGTPVGAIGHKDDGPLDGAVSFNLGADPASGSEVFAALCTDTGNTTTPGTGWTEIHDQQDADGTGIQSQIRAATAGGLPAFVDAGAGVITQASGGALSPANPATVDAGDLLIIFTYWEGTATAPSTPTGFTLLDGPRTVNVSTGRCWVFGKKADGTEDGASNALGTPAVTTMRAARCYRFGGGRDDTIANIVGGFAFETAATAAVTDVGVTTPEANCLAVNLVTVADDNALVSFASETGGDWTEAIAEYTSAATTPDYAQQLQTAQMASAGTVNGGSQTMAAADPWGVVGFYIRPHVFDPSVSWVDVGATGAVNSACYAAIEVREATAAAGPPAPRRPFIKRGLALRPI